MISRLNMKRVLVLKGLNKLHLLLIIPGTFISILLTIWCVCVYVCVCVCVW
ncbi:hypothetical protein E2C01_018812 [Portunus trituberculatus]|uniref:Uncharacterized protein n=1 Tax=Portunus trituberculatus TaxID=210409 RepID=A0A5B7DXD3_PORTR|nr:hypothetical protein [Portunus trituberculatus]